MNDQTAITILERLKPTDQVLDVGGWHTPFNRADWLIDIMPYATRNKPGAFAQDRMPTERFTEGTYLQTDICKTPWPFRDKQFDFVLCSHTLEDIRDPIGVCAELVRVARAGYIEVPSRLVESSKGVERPFYCGYYHHRWLCETEGTKISFMFKPAMLHAYRRFHFNTGPFRKINPKYESTGFFWDGSFQFEEKIIIDRNDVQKDLINFKGTFQNSPDLFTPKYNWRGQKLR